MKIALLSLFLDEDYGNTLNDNFMENVICQEDHFYHRIARSLKTANHEPTVFYISVEKKLKKFKHKYGHEIIRVPAKKIPFYHEPIVYSSELIRQIEGKFDICQIASGYYVMYKVPDMFDYVVRKLHNKIPIIARWSGGNSDWLFPIRKNLKEKSLNNCNKIICSGKNEISILKEKFKIPESKILHMYNPIDTNQFKPRTKNEIIEKINFNSNKKYLLYVGRLIKNHGIEIVLDVFKKISKNNKDIILIFIGDGPMYDEIKKYIHKNNLDNLIELKGRLNHEIISYYYNISSLLFHVGPSGGMPNVIMESIVSGLPVIAADSIAANKDLINEKEGTGILVKLDDKIELEEAILKIINQEKENNIKNANLIREFSIENYGIKMNKLFKEITI
jgi:glycosyltransferase involved in cell wall biosynthesis